MHYVKMLKQEGACSPGLEWLAKSAGLTPRQQWDTCPDGSWAAWMLSRRRVRTQLPKEAITGLRDWAMRCARRAITEHAPNALLAAAACHPDEKHRDALLKHAETLAQQEFSDAARYAAAAADAADAAAAAADAARYAARYAADARYAAADAADAARSKERRQQADDLRECIRWEWVEDALAKAGIQMRTPTEGSSAP